MFQESPKALEAAGNHVARTMYLKSWAGHSLGPLNYQILEICVLLGFEGQKCDTTIWGCPLWSWTFQLCLGNVLLLRALVVAVTSVLTGPALLKLSTGSSHQVFTTISRGNCCLPFLTGEQTLTWELCLRHAQQAPNCLVSLVLSRELYYNTILYLIYYTVFKVSLKYHPFQVRTRW